MQNVMAIKKVEVSVEVKNNTKKGFDDVRDDIKGFQSRIKSETAINLSINVAQLRSQLEKVRSKIKQAKASGDYELEIQLRADEERLKQQLTQANRELRNFARTGQKDVSVLGKLFSQVTNEIDKTRKELISVGKSTKQLDKVEKALKNGSISAEQARTKISQLNTTTSKFGKTLKTVGTYFGIFWAVNKIKNIGSAIIRLGTNLEQSQVAFTTLLGSADKANKVLSDLTDFAKKTPFEIVGLRDTTKQLLAFGIEQEKLIPTLKSLGDVAAGLSVPIEQVAYAYGQVRSANQLYGTELRQFVNAGIPILQKLADQFGVTEAEAKKLVEQGKVGFSDVEQAFQEMTSEGGRFFDLMDKQSKTVAGRWSNLKDTATALGEEFGTKLLPVLNKLIDFLTNYGQEVVNFFIGFGKSLFEVSQTILKDIITPLFNGITTVTNQFFSIFNQDTKDGLEKNLNLWQTFAVGLNTLLAGIKDVVRKAGVVVEGLTPFVPALKDPGAFNPIDYYKGLAKDWRTSGNLLKDELSGIGASIIDLQNANISAASGQGLKSPELKVDFKAPSIQKSKELTSGTGGSSKAIDEQAEAEEELDKKRAIFDKRRLDSSKKRISALEDEKEAVSDVIDSEINKSEKLIEQLDKEIDSIRENIAGLDADLADLDAGAADDLSKRFIEVKDTIAELKEELSQEGEFEIRSDLQNQIDALEQEKKLIEENTTLEARREAERAAGLSEAQTILENLEASKAALEEKKLIQQQELEALQVKKDEEQLILDSFTQDKIELDEYYANETGKIEEQITDKLTIEANKRIDKLEELRQKALAAAEAMRSAGMSAASSSGSSESSVNVGGIVINGSGDPIAVANEVNKIILNSSKNARKGNY